MAEEVGEKWIRSDEVLAIADEAARAILRVREEREGARGGVETKGDGSPVTEADKAAHAVIARGLREGWPGVPVVSEEDGDLGEDDGDEGKRERRASARSGHYWLVDPLDGTKEFIAGRPEFTVNIALVRVSDGMPVFGCVVVPIGGEAMWGGPALGGSWRRAAWGDAAAAVPPGLPTPARPSPAGPGSLSFRVASSRSHGGEDAKLLAAARALFLPMNEGRQGLGPGRGRADGGAGGSGAEIELVRSGSSLKVLWVADGRADAYPRLGPTHAWDTAAAHAVLLGVGGEIFAWVGEDRHGGGAREEERRPALAGHPCPPPLGPPLRYHKPGVELNPFFAAVRGSLFAQLPV